MKIKKLHNIACFIVATMSSGELNCNRTYERVYMHSEGQADFFYSAGGKYAPVRKEIDPENIAKLVRFVREKQQNAVSGRRDV